MTKKERPHGVLEDGKISKKQTSLSDTFMLSSRVCVSVETSQMPQSGAKVFAL